MLTHSIHSVLLEFIDSAHSEQDLLSVAKAWFYDEFLPILDEELEHLNSSKSNQIINRLELDISLANYKDSSAIRTSIKKAIEAHPPKLLTNEEANQEQLDGFYFFLQNGFWPASRRWQDEAYRKNSLQKMLSDRSQLNHFFAHDFNQNSLIRLANLLINEKKWQTLFLTWMKEKHRHLLEWIIKHTEEKKWQHFLFPNSSLTRRSTFLLQALLQSDPITHKDQLYKFLQSSMRTDIESSISHPSMAAAQTLNLLNFRTEEDAFQKVQQWMNADNHSAFTQDSIRMNDSAESIKISNAGLVLLHPFLPMVFRELGWMNHDGFVSTLIQAKAVLFLQHLINEKSVQKEHELPLNKLLCNWPMHAPLPLHTRFSKQEKKIAQELLQSLIEHWSALKNTSINGLRESFLKRNALLKKVENGYLIQVEKKSIDILLDQLPFGISTLKHPYHEYFLFTEWA